MAIFYEIPASAIDSHTWRETDKHLAHIRAELKLPPVKIRWFVDPVDLPPGVAPISEFVDDARLLGVFHPGDTGAVWVKARRPLAGILHVLAHELCHLAGHVKGSCYAGQASELAADEVAERLINSYQENWSVYAKHALSHDYHAEELRQKQEAAARSKATGWDRLKRESPAMEAQSWFKESRRREAKARAILEKMQKDKRKSSRTN